jgi:uncharacterized protein YdbL (DUF1318 family)
MKKSLLSLAIRLLALSLLLASCVTVNIYFPAEEVKSAADQIVGEVWGGETSAPAAPPVHGSGSTPLSSLFGVSDANADQNINVNTPEIAAIKNAMRERAPGIKKFLASGAVGVANGGYLRIRDASALAPQERAELNGVLAAENQDRSRLYREIARANGFPNQWSEVEAIFAKSWIQQAEPGWYVEGAGGWVRR